MGLDAEEVQTILVDGKDAGGQHSHIAAALDEEERGAKHGGGAEEAWDGRGMVSMSSSAVTARTLSSVVTCCPHFFSLQAKRSPLGLPLPLQPPVSAPPSLPAHSNSPNCQLHLPRATQSLGGALVKKI